MRKSLTNNSKVVLVMIVSTKITSAIHSFKTATINGFKCMGGLFTILQASENK